MKCFLYLFWLIDGLLNNNLYIIHYLYIVIVHIKNGKGYRNNGIVNEGDVVIMEVDLRSEEKSKRTLHFFIGGKQQKIFFSELPSKVQFGVFFRKIFLFSFLFI